MNENRHFQKTTSNCISYIINEIILSVIRTLRNVTGLSQSRLIKFNQQRLIASSNYLIIYKADKL